MTARHRETPDGRYLIVKGRLLRLADPSLPDDKRKSPVSELTTARLAIRDAKRSGDEEAEAETHRTIDAVKRALGERGPVWWTDGAPDLNRHMAKNTPYAEWFADIAKRRH